MQPSSCFWQNSERSTEHPAQPPSAGAASVQNRDHALPGAHGTEQEPDPRNNGGQTLILHLRRPGFISQDSDSSAFPCDHPVPGETTSRSSLARPRDQHQGWLSGHPTAPPSKDSIPLSADGTGILVRFTSMPSAKHRKHFLSYSTQTCRGICKKEKEKGKGLTLLLFRARWGRKGGGNGES